MRGAGQYESKRVLMLVNLKRPEPGITSPCESREAERRIIALTLRRLIQFGYRRSLRKSVCHKLFGQPARPAVSSVVRFVFVMESLPYGKGQANRIRSLERWRARYHAQWILS